MDLNEALTALGTQIGIANLAPDRWGLCHVRFDGRLPVTFSAGEGTLAMLATIGPVHGESPAVLENLLAANYLGCGTHGATLAIDDAGTLFLERVVPSGPLSHGDWLELVTRFVDALEFWTLRYDEGSLAFGGAPAAPAAMPPAAYMLRV